MGPTAELTSTAEESTAAATAEAIGASRATTSVAKLATSEMSTAVG